MIKKYYDFINESSTQESEEEFKKILNLPLSDRNEFETVLSELFDIKDGEINSSEEYVDTFIDILDEPIDDPIDKIDKSINESIIKDIYSWASSKFNKWLSKKAVGWLINQNEKQLANKIEILKMLDPSDFSDIYKVEAMYLGGGIDKTSETGAAGWRENVENFFGMDHVIVGEDMIKLGKSGKLNYGNYDKPLILNPLRNELVRTDDPRFGEIFKRWKSGDLNKETDHEDWKYWAGIINKEIYAPDLRILNACDTNLVKLDPSAGAGTLGEMQVTALRNMNVFLWLDNGYEIQDISPWTIPSVTKLVRNDQELDILLNNIKNINK